MKILSVDLGLARTGLAICDAGEMLASPVGVIHDKNMDSVLKKVAAAAEENKAEEVVVGNPINMDGSSGERSQACIEFGEKLRGLLDVPVRLWDERGTTVSAHGYLNQTDTRGKKRRNVIDAVAATIILESYLAYRKNHRNE